MGDKFVVEWGEHEVIAPAVLEGGSLSVTTGTGQEWTNFPATVLFDRAQVELRGYGAPLYGAWAGVVRLPLSLPTNPPAVWFKTDIRLSADLDAGTRALVVIAAEWETIVRELSPEAPERGSERQGEAAGMTHRSHTIEIVHKAPALPARHYTASIFLTAERRDAKGAVRVSVDSLDIVVNPDFQSLPQPG